MGYDTECKVAGIGTVQIKTNDGVVRTLSKVRTFVIELAISSLWILLRLMVVGTQLRMVS